MAESAVLTAVINQVVEIGAKLLVETGSHSYHLKEDIEWIESKMRHFKSCLKDAESKQDGSYEVANSINDMRNLALVIEDILDTYLPEIESHKGKGPFRFVKHAACILCYGATANTFARKIERIKRRAQEIEATRERCRINLDPDGGNADMDVWDRRKRFLVAPESIFVGREDTLQEVKEKLRSSNLDCKMICIVGDAGVGKTTAGKKIYKEVQNEFTSSALVYVSNEPRVQDLLLEIAKQVGLEKEKMNENLEVNLRSLLNEKRCLIFLDDIWTTEAWDDLKNVIPMNSRNGSRIIITSRRTDVGRYIGSESSLIELKLLDQEKSWELFSESMKSSSENMSERFPPKELEDIAKKIVKRCGGLPLAIVVAVGMLRQRRRNKHAWNEVLDILSTSSENNCSKILSLSYKDLPPDLKPFFLYFGLFPEDEEIVVFDLVKAWLAEKLIQDDGNRNPDDIAAAKLEMLSDRNLIQVSRRDLDGRVISCRIHDLLHVFCIEMAEENNFFCTSHNIHSNSFSMLRRLTVDNTSQYSFSNSKTPKLRNLLCFSNWGEEWSLIPNEIGNLSSLTCLKLSGKFQKIPSTIRNLKKLVTLDIGQAQFRFQLPRTILRMKHLKHLLLDDEMFESNKCTKLNVRNEVCLPNIKTLRWVPGAILKARSLQKLSNLRQLALYEANDEHLNAISGKTPISKKLHNLELFVIQKFKRLNLSHYDHLTKLIILGRIFVSLTPDIIEFPPNLIYLCLGHAVFIEDPMKVLKELPRLEILGLMYCNYSQSITFDFSGENSFPELQVLSIIGVTVDRIPELIVDQTGMPKLYKFECSEKDLNVPERLRKIMVESSLFPSIEEL
ncbi:disease resistance protein RPP13-like [Olea europaea var. sylvestris]|uniref:disease resistance protein RPP13-like n=1 Tax=Olea europaea var. sylvestris TaxID=158386 RepID=UPI000C1CE9FB|nr:disease resistance protein RPP13-like [Olea europaea var. sylvestris]